MWFILVVLNSISYLILFSYLICQDKLSNFKDRRNCRDMDVNVFPLWHISLVFTFFTVGLSILSTTHTYTHKNPQTQKQAKEIPHLKRTLCNKAAEQFDWSCFILSQTWSDLKCIKYDVRNLFRSKHNQNNKVTGWIKLNWKLWMNELKTLSIVCLT